VILRRKIRRQDCHAFAQLPATLHAQRSAFVTSAESDDYLIADLIDLPMAEREGYLLRTCGHDTDMRERLVGKLERLMDSLSTASGSVGPTSARSTRSEIARALTAGLDLHETPGTIMGRYTLLQKIGEGGCGIVYLAEQEQPVRRQVALKLIKLGLDTREFIARFQAERQALALMEHPNIARVFDAGATELGRPYFVMELVRGVPITRFCDEAKLPLRDRLQLFISVCQAVQHAHQKGVIHRDLKPSNILVARHDGTPVAKIIDFGIAKALDAGPTGKTLFTQFHAFMGTPAYISPEQMELGGVDIDTRADIYGLGVLLYELLTGGTPFDNQDLAQAGLDAMRKTIRETEPPRPSLRLAATEPGKLREIASRRCHEPQKLIRLVQGDLDWIALKCLEKDRARRYETSNGLAADLQRHLNDEPVMARPPSTAYRFQKTVRRHKLAFVAGAAVIAALLLGIIASSWQAVRATHAEREAREAESDAAKQELIARQRAYASDMNVAWQALHENNLGRAQDLLDRQRPQPGQSDLRGWEWRYLWQETRSDALSVLCETSEIESLTASFDGRWLAIGLVHKEGVLVWDLKTRQQVAHLASGTHGVRAVFSPTEPLLAYTTAGEGLHLHFWNAITQQSMVDIPMEDGRSDLAFSRDGLTLVTSTESKPNGSLTIWRVSDGTRLASYPANPVLGPPSTAFAVAPDLSVAAIGSWDRVRVVDLRNGQELWNGGENERSLSALAFSPDGKILASAGFSVGDISLWEVATGKEIGRLTGHSDYVTSLVFWPDGSKLASSSGDQTIRTWDVASRTCTDVLRGHRLEVWRLALLPDNRTLVSGCKDGVVCLWDTATTHPRQEHVTLAKNTSALTWCFAPDSRSVLTFDSDRKVTRWSGPNFKEREELLSTGAGVFIGERFSPDGHFVACALPDGSVSVWDVTRRSLFCHFKPADPDAVPTTFHGGGSRLIVWSQSTNRQFDWDLIANREVQSWPAPESSFAGWGLSSNEQQAIAVGGHGDVLVRNLAEESTAKLNLDIMEGSGIAFSPSGGLLAITSWLGYTRVWETTSWKEVATLRGYLNGVFGAAFSPDGHRLATTAGVENEALKLCAVDSWQDVLTLHAEGNLFVEPLFSPDGNAIGIQSVRGGQVHVWRAPTWAEIKQAEVKDRKSTAP